MSAIHPAAPPLKSFTVVYTVRDEKAFVASDEWRKLHDSMASMDASAPFAVTAMSMDHEMRRVQLMEEAVEKYRHRDECLAAVEAISQCPDLSEWSWDKFENDEIYN